MKKVLYFNRNSKAFVLCAALFLTLFFVSAGRTEEMPVGKKVKFYMKSGAQLQGVIKSSDQNAAVFMNGKEEKVISYSDVERVVVLSDQRPVPVATEKPGDRSRRSIHRITPLSVFIGAGGESGGVEICAYEFIGQNGLGVRVTPLSVYGFSKEIQTTRIYSSYYGYSSFTTQDIAEGYYWAPV